MTIALKIQKILQKIFSHLTRERERREICVDIFIWVENAKNKINIWFFSAHVSLVRLIELNSDPYTANSLDKNVLKSAHSTFFHSLALSLSLCVWFGASVHGITANITIFPTNTRIVYFGISLFNFSAEDRMHSAHTHKLEYSVFNFFFAGSGIMYRLV